MLLLIGLEGSSEVVERQLKILMRWPRNRELL